MAIDHHAERIVSFVQAVTELAPVWPDHSISPATIRRWASRGARGVRLETILVGGRRFTSTEAIDRFLAAINAPTVTPSPINGPAVTSPALARRDRESVNRRLDELGL